MLAVMLTDTRIFNLLIGLHKFFGRLDRLVWFVRPDGEKERLLFLLFLLQPADRFFYSQHSRGPFQFSGCLTVANIVGRVDVVRAGIVLCGQPPIVTVIVRLRLIGRVKFSVEVPLADVAGGIAPLAEQLGDADLTLPQVVTAAIGNPTPDTVAIGSAASEDRRAGRRADRASRIALRKPHPFGSKPVEVRRVDARMSVAAQIPPSPDHR